MGTCTVTENHPDIHDIVYELYEKGILEEPVKGMLEDSFVLYKLQMVPL